MSARANGQLEHHLQTIWPESSIEAFEWSLGPIAASLPGFNVLRVGPAVKGQPWVYVSNGACKIESSDRERCEFFITSPEESPSHIETLAMMANIHADPRYRVHLGKVIDIGRPWVDGSEMQHLLVSLPFPYGPKFEYFLADGRTVRILWLLPISKDEAALALRAGVDALERRFDEVAIDYLDIHRSSVV